MILPNFNSLVDAYMKALKRLFAGRTAGIILDPDIGADPQFQAMAYKLAYRMAQMAAAQNMKSWRTAAMKSMRAREIYEALQEEIKRTGLRPELQVIATRNAKLIRSVPRQIAQHLTAKATTLRQEGRRDSEIVAELKKLAPQLTKSRMKLIARTEVSKAETALTQLRAEKIGLDWYEWQTSRDARVRDSHRHMDKVLVSWKDPPSPEALIHLKSSLGRYHAGEAPNDRCLALPIVSLDEIRFPAKVYHDNAITRMTRHQFSQMAGIAA